MCIFDYLSEHLIISLIFPYLDIASLFTFSRVCKVAHDTVSSSIVTNVAVGRLISRLSLLQKKRLLAKGSEVMVNRMIKIVLRSNFIFEKYTVLKHLREPPIDDIHRLEFIRETKKKLISTLNKIEISITDFALLSPNPFFTQWEMEQIINGRIEWVITPYRSKFYLNFVKKRIESVLKLVKADDSTRRKCTELLLYHIVADTDGLGQINNQQQYIDKRNVTEFVENLYHNVTHEG